MHPSFEAETDRPTNDLISSMDDLKAPPTAPMEKPAAGGKLVMIAVVLVVLALVGAWVVHKRSAKSASAQGPGRGAQPPAPVVLGSVAQKDVPIYLDGIGTVQAFSTVTVRARVDGALVKVAFNEGVDVKSNDVLAQIDPAPFNASLGQAAGKKAQDEAQLANAELDLKRETALVQAKIDSQQVLDTQQALVNQLAATVQADAAAVTSAKVQLDYTTIRSPISGRTGLRLVDEGNIVHASDANGLVVITQLQPICIVFTLPEQALNDIHAQFGGANLEVLAMGRDNSTLLDRGQLTVIDNQIDPATGTIRLKATFPNPGLRLWPGQFVNVRLLLTVKKNGLVVPASVVQRGPNGAYAFIVQGEGTNMSVQQQPITVARIEDGQALIEEGLQAGQRVVVDGQFKLQNGSKVVLAGGGEGEGGGGGGSRGRGRGGTNSLAAEAGKL